MEYEGATKIMAFNMKEDLEEGHFDTGGNFIFNKKENMIKDAWLDNIDWDNLKNKAGKNWNKVSPLFLHFIYFPFNFLLFEIEDADEEDGGPKADVESIYTRLLEILTDDKETIGSALKRLNSEKGRESARSSIIRPITIYESLFPHRSFGSRGAKAQMGSEKGGRYPTGGPQ